MPRVERLGRLLEHELDPAAQRRPSADRRRRSCRGRGTGSPRRSAPIRPRMQRPTVVLPEPLSPTSPSVSPSSILKLTPLTAWTRALRPGIGKCLTSPSTSRTRHGSLHREEAAARSGRAAQLDQGRAARAAEGLRSGRSGRHSCRPSPPRRPSAGGRRARSSAGAGPRCARRRPAASPCRGGAGQEEDARGRRSP